MPPIISCLPVCYGRFGGRGAIENMRTAGVEFIELPIRTAGFPTRFGDDPLVTTDSTLDDLIAVDRMLESHGVRVSSCNINSGNPLQPAAVATIKRKLDLASHFGVTLVVGEAGAADGDESLQRLYGNLTEIGDYAAELGITYCCETHPGLCGNHRNMLKTMQAIDHPCVRLNFDTGNIYIYNEHANGEIALAKVCQYVRHLHLKDTPGRYLERDFPQLGKGGAVDFVRVLETMRSCAFNGPYGIEVPGMFDEGPLTIEAYQSRLRRSVRYLKSCGYADA